MWWDSSRWQRDSWGFAEVAPGFCGSLRDDSEEKGLIGEVLGCPVMLWDVEGFTAPLHPPGAISEVADGGDRIAHGLLLCALLAPDGSFASARIQHLQWADCELQSCHPSFIGAELPSAISYAAVDVVTIDPTRNVNSPLADYIFTC